MKSALIAILVSAATSLAAEPFLQQPIDCTLGENCFVEDYVDHDPGVRSPDYTCGYKARDDHRGTDFALPGVAEMQDGISVLAAAPGVVQSIRDGEVDRIYEPERHDLNGQECGNAVRIAHANGLSTLYCHLARGSVAVTPGQQVRAGQMLGRVGLSGQTTFPHLHFGVFRGGRAIDPFAPTAQQCGNSTDTLWLAPPDYEPTGLATAGFSDEVPEMDGVRDGSVRRAQIASDAPLVLYGLFFLANPATWSP